MFNKKAELDRLWRLILQKEQETQEELRDMRTKGVKTTARYENLKRDAAKLKAEYEKLKGTGAIDPTNVNHLDRYSDRALKQTFLEGADTTEKDPGLEDR
jgi:hypothetical protein